MSWLRRNAEVVEALAASVTALVAVAALVGVKFQLDEADRLQREQSAREAYRAHLALAATQPDFAEPQDGCALIASPKGGAYVAFVDHLLYSAEQMLPLYPTWEASFLSELEVHGDLMCSAYAPIGEIPETEQLITTFQTQTCEATPRCQ
ncbi:MAG: hypothetical protein AAF280_15240 [Pseudomonadota bacterium]